MRRTCECKFDVFKLLDTFANQCVIYSVSEFVGAMSTGIALIISPVTISFCRKKSTRITAVFGGLLTALGCLFTSFATQFHQLYFSYGTVVGKFYPYIKSYMVHIWKRQQDFICKIILIRICFFRNWCWNNSRLLYINGSTVLQKKKRIC